MALEPRYQVANLADAVIFGNGTNCWTEYPIKGEEHGWTLKEIVGKAISILGVNTKGKNNQQVFDEYCDILDSKVQGGVPYSNNMFVSKKDNITSVISSFREMMPIENTSLEFKCKETVETAFKGVDLSVANGVFFASDKKVIKIDEFIVMQVLNTGYCIDIIPTYIEFYGVAEGQRIFFSSINEASASINYRQKKYTLNRGHVQSIIKKLDDDEKNSSF